MYTTFKNELEVGYDIIVDDEINKSNITGIFGRGRI